MNKLLARPQVREWLTVAGTATLVLGAAYAMVQQSTRLSANDLPLAAAQTARQELKNGSAAKDVIPSLNTDLRQDNSTFTIITDNTQHVIASSASLDGQTPLPPSGVFSYTASNGEDHFTWQPSTEVRLATEVVKYGQGADGGFIVTGQSLKPYEDRISGYGWIALAAWVAVIAWSYLLLLLPRTRAQ